MGTVHHQQFVLITTSKRNRIFKHRKRSQVVGVLPHITPPVDTVLRILLLFFYDRPSHHPPPCTVCFLVSYSREGRAFTCPRINRIGTRTNIIHRSDGCWKIRIHPSSAVHWMTLTDRGLCRRGAGYEKYIAATNIRPPTPPLQFRCCATLGSN